MAGLPASAPRRLDFRDHRRELRDNRYVYAVVSRRSQGLSIGLNLNPDKVCNFACPYCQVDRSLPGGPGRVDLARLEAELQALLEAVRSEELWTQPPFDTAAPALRQVRDISWAGDGEPTSSRAFAGSVEIVGRLRAAEGLEAVKLQLLTNATLLHRAGVAEGVDALHALGGVVWGKLDAGTEPFFHRVDGTQLPFRRVLDNLALAARRWRLVLQCMFMRYDGQGPPAEEIEAWAGRIAALLDGGGEVQEVQVYTVARVPSDPKVEPLSDDALQAIGARAARLGLPVRVVRSAP